MAKVFQHDTRMFQEEGHASVSVVLSILQLIGQKSQHPRIVSFGEIDVVKPVGTVEPLELPRYFGIRKCIPIPWIVYVVSALYNLAKRRLHRSVLRVIMRSPSVRCTLYAA
jgi:hypothetical protein